MIYTEMDTNKLSDQHLLGYILGNLVKQVCNCDLILQNQASNLDKYPYVTFNFITPEIDETSDWLGKGRHYTTIIQIDAHSNNFYEANDLSQKLHEALNDTGYRRFFKQAGIVPQQISNTSNRTALSGINYDNDFGFDCSFLVTGGISFQKQDLNFTYSPPGNIEEVNITNKVRGKDSLIKNRRK